MASRYRKRDDLTSKTICALAPSHYQQDLLESWFEKWAAEIDKEEVDHHFGSVIDIWHVEAPERAFKELPYDVMGRKYKRTLRQYLCAHEQV